MYLRVLGGKFFNPTPAQTAAYAAMYLWKIASQSAPRVARSSSPQSQKPNVTGSVPGRSVSISV